MLRSGEEDLVQGTAGTGKDRPDFAESMGEKELELEGRVAVSVQVLQRIMLGIQSFLFGGKR